MFPVRELETSRDKPYVLGDVKKTDFDRLLAHLYPRILGTEETETTQGWISILELASKWGFNSLRSKAISKVEQTLDSPVDMVTLGRQYGIPDVLLPGYAVLCQSTDPLSYEEGLRLGMEDVVNIYRIRHELYGAGIMPVPLEVAFAKVEEAGLGAERQASVQASTWTDVGSVAASQTSAENEESGSVTLTPNVESHPLEVASTGATTVSEKTKQQYVDAHLPSDEPTSGALGNRGSDVPSSVFPGNVSNTNSGSSVSVREGFKLIEELATSKFDLISSDIVQWANTTDIQTLHQITRLIVEKAIEAPEHSILLCREMVNCTQTLHPMTRLIVEKAMEEPCQFKACARLCNMLMKDAHGCATASGWPFRLYLGEVCQENMETVAASVAAAGGLAARVRRRRLIEFIGALSDLKAMELYERSIVDKWVTTLLDANDEEKVETLCMALMRADQLHASCDMTIYVQRVRNVVQETSKPRVRKLLQNATRGNWSAARAREDCTMQ